MTHKFSSFMDAIDNPGAPALLRFVSGLFWALVLAGFFFCCLFLAFVFQ